MFFLHQQAGFELKLVERSMAPDITALWRQNSRRLVDTEPWAARPGGTDDASDWIAYMIDRWTSGSGYFLAVVVDGETVGTIGAIIDRWNDCASIGYFIDARAEGKGVITRAARVVVRDLFENRGVMRCEIGASVENTRSRAVAERLGFTFEGIQRSFNAFPTHRADRAVYSLLPSDPASSKLGTCAAVTEHPAETFNSSLN